MKIIWEDSDITHGRRVTKPGSNEVWMIGYLAFATEKQDEDAVVLISLNDGMVTTPADPLDFARELTNDGYLPLELLE